MGSSTAPKSFPAPGTYGQSDSSVVTTPTQQQGTAAGAYTPPPPAPAPAPPTPAASQVAPDGTTNNALYMSAVNNQGANTYLGNNFSNRNASGYNNRAFFADTN